VVIDRAAHWHVSLLGDGDAEITLEGLLLVLGLGGGGGGTHLLEGERLGGGGGGCLETPGDVSETDGLCCTRAASSFRDTDMEGGGGGGGGGGLGTADD
jgi:hypothetical protein